MRFEIANINLFQKDDSMLQFLITMLIGFAVGYVFLKLKVPGGIMVGSIVGVALLNITTGTAFMPYTGRLIAQIIAGAFIGVSIEKSDLVRLKSIFKPAMTLLLGMLGLNIMSGLLIHFFSPLDLITSLMSAVPGGISDIPIISEEMGADSATVAVMQFIRLVFGVGVFPTIITKISKFDFYKRESEVNVYSRTINRTDDISKLILTIIVAAIFGTIGKISDIPSATLVFSMISVIILKLTTGKACMPRWMRRFAQLLAGAYIGSSFEMSDVISLKYLIIPAVILLGGYLAACLIIGNILYKKYKMPIDEAMLSATPAGAADMALISADMGIQSADVIVLQIIRMVTVVSIFPQIIRVIVSLIN